MVEDLKSECLLAIIESGYRYNVKENKIELLDKKYICKRLNRLIYKIKNDIIVTSLESENESDIKEVEKISFLVYERNDKNITIKKKTKNVYKIIKELGLTDKQKEVFKIWVNNEKNNSKTAVVLGITERGCKKTY